jgi:uncharacterized protein DUF3606
MARRERRIVISRLERTSDMSGELKNSGPADPSRVNVDDPSEVKYRLKEYGCTEQQLRQAVAAVGASAAKVRQYFKNKSRPARRQKIGYY